MANILVSTFPHFDGLVRQLAVSTKISTSKAIYYVLVNVCRCTLLYSLFTSNEGSICTDLRTRFTICLLYLKS